MDQPVTNAPQRRGRGLSGTLILLGAFGVTGTAAWLYYRARQRGIDERTRDRLQPHGAGQ
jgi:hypothetical protein